MPFDHSETLSCRLIESRAEKSWWYISRQQRMCWSCNAQGSHAQQDAERDVICLQLADAVFYGRKVRRSSYLWFVGSTSLKRVNVMKRFVADYP